MQQSAVLQSFKVIKGGTNKQRMCNNLLVATIN